MKELIEQLSKYRPKYAKNYDNFKDGDFIQYSGQCWDEKEMYAMLDTIVNGSWITAGSKVASFQNKFSRKFNVKYSQMVNSGSSANLVLIAAAKKHFGWEDGDEIIVSPVGFPTTIAPIVQNGLVPLFIDIEMRTLNFDVDLIIAKITDKTKAIFVSPVLGNPPDMQELKRICRDHNLILLGDNCDSLGATWGTKLITDYYFAWSSSFYPAHHISTGEGGMISSNNDEYMKIVQSMAWWGRDCYCVGANNLLACGTCGNRFDKWIEGYDGIIDHKYLFTNIGYNLKPLDMQGAIGIEQLEKFDELHRKRTMYKNIIHNFFKAYIKEVRVVEQLTGAEAAWFGVPILCPTQQIKEELVQHFEKNNIQTRSYFSGNILMHPGYKHLDDYRKYPNANLALSNVFFIGCSPLYNDKILTYIMKVCKAWNQK